VETAIADTAATDLTSHDIVDVVGVFAGGKEGREARSCAWTGQEEVRHGPALRGTLVVNKRHVMRRYSYSQSDVLDLLLR
jgi:hypothetical protein